MQILIAGDFFVKDEFNDKDLISNSVLELFADADYKLLNLEAPLTSDNLKNKILKTGPHLRSSSKTSLTFLEQLKIDAVTLANNHILDYGEEGLNNTLRFCNNTGIDTVGAGGNLKEAKKPLRKVLDGKLISFINFAENEWASASEESSGAHPMNIIDNTRIIRSEKEHADYVIVIIHGGHEYYKLPSPRMVKLYRFFVDNGADAIVGHHTHCIGGYEVYNDAPIIYSLGNFLFTKINKPLEWYNGLLVKLFINEKEKIDFKIIPTVQDKKTMFVNLASYEEKNLILSEVDILNKIITDDASLKKSWLDYSKNKTENYIDYFSPVNMINNNKLRGLLYRLKIQKLFRSKTYFKLILNLIRCEAHSDLVMQSLKNYLKK